MVSQHTARRAAQRGAGVIRHERRLVKRRFFTLRFFRLFYLSVGREVLQ